MRHFLTLICFGLIITTTAAQCPTSAVLLTTQAQVNSFSTTYPNCNILPTNLVIAGNDITNLGGLSELAAIGGKLEVHHCPLLPSLTGLDNLNNIGGSLRIFRNNGLQNLDGLGSLTTVTGHVHIGQNALLTNVSGLSSLTWVGNWLRLINNDDLSDLSGFDALTHVENFISIKNNDGFSSLDGFNAIDGKVGIVALKNNGALQSVSGFNAIDSVNRSVYFFKNNQLNVVDGFADLQHVGRSLSAHTNISLDTFKGFPNLNYARNLKFSYNGSLKYIELNSVTGVNYIRIAGNGTLNTIKVPNLVSVDSSLFIYSNGLLNSVGFSSLSEIGHNFEFYHTNSANLSGFSSLSTIGGYLAIGSNSTLNNIEGLSNLTFIGGNFTIYNNDALITLDGLSNLDAIGGASTIVYNNLLSDCAIFALCSNLATPPSSTIVYSNAVGCNNTTQITTSCGTILSTVSGSVFIDFDCNGSFDGLDQTAANRNLYRTNGNIFASTDPAGNYARLLLPNTANNFTALPYIGYNVAPDSIPVQTDFSVQTYANSNFRFCPDTTIHDVQTSISSYTVPRPGFTHNYHICYQNTGTQPEDITIVFEFSDNSASNYASIYNAAGGVVTENSATWTFTDVPPFQQFCFNIAIQMATNTPLGTTLTPQVTAYLPGDISDDNPNNNFDDLSQTVVGSYDPNDKTPDQPLVLFEDADSVRIQYLIRFQNTGTYPATFIEVLDTINNTLNINTIEMVSASHPYTLSFPSANVLKWRFDDINLPDSTSNEPGSHGYISFSIKTKNNLALGSAVTNRAFIYFDYNQPVITNTATSPLLTAAAISANNTVAFQEDQSWVFSLGNFPAIAQLYPFTKIHIVETPASGYLFLDTTLIQTSKIIPIDSIGWLEYIGELNEYGVKNFKFKVENEYEISEQTYTMNINIISVNDAPSSHDTTVTAYMNLPYLFNTGNFAFNDVETANMSGVKIISLPNMGSLKIGNNIAQIGQIIQPSNIPNLKYMPPTDSTGSPFASFTFRVYDSLTFSDTQTVYINIIDTTTNTSIPADWQLTVGPNPVENTLHISGKLPAQQATYTLSDNLGRTILTKNLRLENQMINTQIPMDALPTGVYYLSVSSENGSKHTFKVFKL